MTSPFATPGPWDNVASAYAEELTPAFEHYAREALRLAALAPAAHVVDVAAGPGTLARVAARDGHRVAALDFSPKMIATLRARIEEAGLTSLVDAREGDGMALPYDDSSFDAGFSMFGLIFFPDRSRGFRELLRVVKPGAPVVVSSWLPFDSVPLMAAAFGAFAELLPPPAGTPPFRPPLAEREDCIEEMSAAGFRDVVVHDVTFEPTTESVDEYWAGMVRTAAPIALRKQQLGERFAEVSDAIVARLRAQFGSGPQTYPMRAHLIFGRR